MVHQAEHDSTEIRSKAQICEAWRTTASEVLEVFGRVSESEFNADRDGRWTLAKNLDHLTRSGMAVAKGLKMPKFVLRLTFGRGSTSRPLAEIRATYLQALADGGQARGRFQPEGTASQPLALTQWTDCSDLLLRNIDRWSESQLDSHRMPHPLIGRLTVREMLFFTIIHTQHHLDNVRSG